MAELEKESSAALSRGPWGDKALPDLRSSGYSADGSHSLRQGCGGRLGDSFPTVQGKKKWKWKYFASPPPINHSAFSIHLSRSPCQG